MHTVELLEEALALAARLGVQVRQDDFGGASAACELRGQRYVFLDIGASPREHLEQVLSVLRELTPRATLTPSPALASLLEIKQAA